MEPCQGWGALAQLRLRGNAPEKDKVQAPLARAALTVIGEPMANVLALSPTRDGRTIKPAAARPAPEARSAARLPHICLGWALPCDQSRIGVSRGPHDSISLTMRLIK